jgi:hypothetical protein
MDNCPFYFGPVHICILGGIDLLEESATKEVLLVVKWLMRQPSMRPHWMKSQVLQLGTLLDNTPEDNIVLDHVTYRTQY